MFKRLKRIEGLMEKFVAGEQECLKLVQRRDVDYALWKASREAERVQVWKCEWPDCAVVPYHVHMISEPSTPPQPTSKGVESE